MQQTQLLKINFPGGIVSPGSLLQLLEMAAGHGVKGIRFGSRQQLLIAIPAGQATTFATQCAGKGMTVSTTNYTAENIVSSYAAAGIFITEGWLSQGIYKDVFDSFDAPLQLKVNINDAGQTFVPLFTGHINWIASPHLHFWYLYVRFPKTNTVFRWPQLIYTNHLFSLSKNIEEAILRSKITEAHRLVDVATNKGGYIAKPIEKELVLPNFHLPYYEGFHPSGNNFWLGLYRRDEIFTIRFLKELCKLCLQTKINELYITSWKTLIIKGIEKAHRPLWDYLLGHHRINVRHAANELAWLVEDNSEDGLILKRQVIRYFDKEDVRTYGLCFSIKTKSASGMFGSVVIRKEEVKNPDRLKTLDRFTILYTKEFNPNSGEVIIFREGVKKEHLGPYLVSLCKQFYETANTGTIAPINTEESIAVTTVTPLKSLHQCRHCFTVYDETLGDPEQQIVAGTGFYQLPGNYCCPLCEAGKDDFQVMKEQKIPMAT